MVNKNYLLLICLCLASLAPVRAQESQTQTKDGSAQWGARDMTYRSDNYDVLDTNYISKRKMPQQKKFLNHQYAFPARPRTMWEVGFGLGDYNIIGAVPSLNAWQKGGYGFHVDVRKSWGYIFSTRFEYIYGIAKGLEYRQLAPNATNNPTWINNGYGKPGTDIIFNNYRMESHQFNLDLMVNIGNINFHHGKNKLSFYGYLGLGGLLWATRINELNGNTPYDFATIVGSTPQTLSNKNNVRKKLQSAMDDSYETPAINRGTSAAKVNGMSLDPFISLGAGIQYHISNRVSIQIEDRLGVPNGNNNLTGLYYDNTAAVAGVPNASENLVNYASLGINFTIGNKKKRVEPFYWINPLDHAYNELSYPRHMTLPTPILPDADGDGIADQFDKCPATPAGVAVDSHGCPMDTDGDGVPDFRDKQLITPTECQPVDADGVGKCPCPEGCGSKNDGAACGNIGAGSIIFPENSARITSAMQVQLATLSAQMQANPNCKVVITGAGNSNKIQQQRSWDRVHAIIQYMSEKNGISRDRFIFQYGQAGEPTAVMYRSAMVGETGGDNPPPPFPNMREKEGKK